MHAAGTAHATTEFPAAHDARSVGMGGTGTSFMHNAAAAVLNPGALQGVENFAVNATFQPGVLWQEAPLGPGLQLQAEPAFIPFFFAGAAVRVHERIVVALAVSPTLGVSSHYKNIQALGGADIKMSLLSMEATAAVSVRLLDNLSLGVGYRATYTSMQMQQPVNLGPMVSAEAKSDISGINALGARVGLHYQPIKPLQLGVTYTSKINTDLEGKTTLAIPMAGAAKLNTTSEVAAPHGVRVGGSYEVIENKLLLALDLKALLYSGSNKEQKIVKETPMGDQVEVIKQNWKNSYGAALGAEYRVVDSLALRLGYNVANSSVPKSTAGIAGLPPALLHSVHAGVGVNVLPSLNIDVAAYYLTVGKEISGMGPTAGNYQIDMVMGSLSATYHR